MCVAITLLIPGTVQVLIYEDVNIYAKKREVPPPLRTTKGYGRYKTGIITGIPGYWYYFNYSSCNRWYNTWYRYRYRSSRSTTLVLFRLLLLLLLIFLLIIIFINRRGTRILRRPMINRRESLY